ncbi:MAG: AEC family transporter [Desulfovibrionaceae bacterium]|nr:AEC family transporter [Desulfovibrionaceae bacterium]
MLAIFFLLSPVFVLVAIGILVERFRLLPRDGAAALNMLVFNLSLPSLIFHAMAASEPADLARGAYAGGIMAAMLLCCALVHGLLALGFRARPAEAGIMGVLASYPNAAFIGLPILMLLFPDNSHVVLAVTITAIFSVPLLLIGMVEQEWCRNAGTLDQRLLLRKVAGTLARNPLLLATVAGVLVCALRLPVPDALLIVCRSLAATATPCALVALGMVLSIQMSSPARGQSHPARQVVVNAGKLILHPLLTLAALSWLGVSGDWLAMGVILAGMPTAVVSYVLSETYNTATRDASQVIVVNSALSVLTVPLMVFLLQRAGIMAGAGL